MKGLIVLDIDETLISSSVVKEGELKTINQNNFDFNFTLEWKDITYYVFIKKRPFLDEFLDYITKNFKIAVFTAADREYATKILEQLGILDKLEFFKSSESLSIGFDWFKLFVYLKKLKSIPDIDMKRTVIIDDTKEVANRNSKNLIHVSKFEWNDKKSDEDATLLKVLSVLQQIKDLPDWTKVKKKYNII
jgi:RNA polymerase II subunit A small phosphatase-like protein